MSATEYRIDILPHNAENIETRLFSSHSVSDLILAVHSMIDHLPTANAQADARVRLMLTLRHPEEAQVDTSQ